MVVVVVVVVVFSVVKAVILVRASHIRYRLRPTLLAVWLCDNSSTCGTLANLLQPAYMYINLC